MPCKLCSLSDLGALFTLCYIVVRGCIHPVLSALLVGWVPWVFYLNALQNSSLYSACEGRFCLPSDTLPPSSVVRAQVQGRSRDDFMAPCLFNIVLMSPEPEPSSQPGAQVPLPAALQ